MPNIQPNRTPDTKAAAILGDVKKQLGATPNMFTTLAHSAAALGFYTGANAVLSTTKLSAQLREQIAVTVAGINGCDYCASAHTMLGKMRKVSDAELAMNLQGKSSDPATQAVLTFSRKVVETRGHVTPADMQNVRTAGFGDAEIVEIIALVGLNIFTNYFNIATGTEVDFPHVSTRSGVKAA